MSAAEEDTQPSAEGTAADAQPAAADAAAAPAGGDDASAGGEGAAAAASGTVSEDDQVETEPLPTPTDAAEFRRRISRYEDAKEERKTVFANDTLHGFQLARGMYYDAYRLIAFIHMHTLDQLQAINATYTDDEYESDLRKIVIVLRKIGECCYYCNRLDEGIRICETAIEAAGERLRSITWFAYGVMTRIYTEQKEHEKAREALAAAKVIKPDSNILRKAESNLLKGEQGKELDDGPAFLKKRGGRRMASTASSTVRRSGYSSTHGYQGYQSNRKKNEDWIKEWDVTKLITVERKSTYEKWFSCKVDVQEGGETVTKDVKVSAETDMTIHTWVAKLAKEIPGLRIKIVFEDHIVPLNTKMHTFLNQCYELKIFINAVEYRMKVVYLTGIV